MSFAELEKKLLTNAPKTVAVAGARGDEVFEALAEARKKGIARFMLFGDSDQAGDYARRFGLEDAEITHCDSDEDAAAAAVEAVRDDRAQALMKGKVPTAVLLKAVLAEKTVFNRGRLLSHILILETPKGKFLGVSDGGMNLYPDLDQKEEILRSAVECFHALGVSDPKAAVLAAMEVENPKIPESVDAAELQRRWESGGMTVPGGKFIVEGPMALDLAVSPKACSLKGWQGKIQGDADILIVHDISGGNYLGKSLIYMAGYSGGGLVLGGGRPIILLSRSDSAREKYQSIILALSVAEDRN